MSAYPLLETINDPADLRRLERRDLHQLANELRAFLIESVSKTGGHLSSNLGTVELTIALHYAFNTPDDRIVWDVGHQTYGHKILTGRRDAMPTLRQYGGLSGFPKRSESPYDTFGTAHSSTSISAALGMAVAARNDGNDRANIAIIGDGAMSAGMAFEALNNAGDTPDVRLLVILNDNEMSISPPVGSLTRILARLMSGRTYNAARRAGERVLGDFARKVEEHVKGMITPGTLFEEFGFNYIGPIDGHDLDALVPTLQNLKKLKGPQFLHVITRKGQGYKLAEADPVLDGRTMVWAGHPDQKFVGYPVLDLDDGRQLFNFIAEFRTDSIQLTEREDWNQPGRLDDFIDRFESWTFEWLDVPALVRSSPGTFRFPMVDRDPVDRWTFGRTTLLGDAAHPMYPIGSNGASQAILDARVLTGCLRAYPTDVDRALARYEEIRRPATAQIVLANRGLGPERPMQLVEERAPDGFDALDDVITPEEILEVTDGYRRTAGFALEALATGTSIADRDDY